MKFAVLFSWIFIFFSLLLNQANVVHSECNFCNTATNTACYSSTEFRQCNNNEPFGIIYKCNPNTYCSIQGGCTSSEEASDCRQCKKCDKSKTFACIGTQRFALCLGRDTPSEITGQCTEDLTCNLSDSKICGRNTPTCSVRDDPETTTEPPIITTTTPSPAQNPNAFCRLIQTEGRYPVGTDPQTTCRQFVSCVKVGATWYGPIYNCPGQTYFDSSEKSCVVARPSICTGVVTRLAFRDLILE